MYLSPFMLSLITWNFKSASKSLFSALPVMPTPDSFATWRFLINSFWVHAPFLVSILSKLSPPLETSPRYFFFYLFIYQTVLPTNYCRLLASFIGYHFYSYQFFNLLSCQQFQKYSAGFELHIWTLLLYNPRLR